jgi:hypothetical protein
MGVLSFFAGKRNILLFLLLGKREYVTRTLFARVLPNMPNIKAIPYALANC